MAHVKQFDTSKPISRDDALIALYGLIKERDGHKPGAFATLDDDARRAYWREAAAKSRLAANAAAAMGNLKPNRANIRDALADAALMLLAVDGPGADEVRRVLAIIFAKRPGVPMTVSEKARSGKLHPKLFSPDTGGQS